MRLLACWFLLAGFAFAAVDLRIATVVVPGDFDKRERKAVSMLVEEVERRTGIRWPVAQSAGGGASLVLSRGRGPAEGYTLRIDSNGATVAGNDARGVLFGAGHLLRLLEMEKGAVHAPEGVSITTAPKYPIRGHQLGYRPKTNSYDGWNVAVWEQYIRDLAAFGTNAIELIPPRSDDDRDSPHFPLPPMRMMIEMSRLADEYGLDVWVWYPALDKDYADPKTVEFALNEWGEVFRRLPRIDAIFVPGGDPGHTPPKQMMALLEKQTANLHRYHPKATMWMSPQGFDKAWMDEFYSIMRSEPAWLTGIVFGPQNRASLPELRAGIPKKYPIRHYPDITHSRHCQYPVPDWDTAYAATEAREVINPRPEDEARIFRLLQPLTTGFITYSEGCNDDVNKFVWSGLGWDPDRPVLEILREYSRYFIGPRYADDFAQGLLALERNWRGPLLTNEGVYATLAQFQTMERRAAPETLANWRFQQALYRAYYDAYTRSRLTGETAQESRALEMLRRARRVGADTAMAEAEAALKSGLFSADWRARVFELAEALYQSIRMQLSVSRYKAISTDRGANLDTIDVPLNNRVWLSRRFAEIRKAETEYDKLKAIEEITDWENPGPGGFYDDLGNVARQPHLVRGPGYTKDPAFLESSLLSFAYRPDLRSSWWDHAEALNEGALQMRYTGLDPAARYKVRVVYGGDSLGRKIRLTANGIEVHPLIAKPVPVKPVEFDIPEQALRTGELTLEWHREPGLGGSGRGNAVSEIWLMKR